MTVRVGDWVRFYQLGQFTIAEVRYIRTRDFGSPLYCTDQGEHIETDFLEVRPPVTKEQ